MRVSAALAINVGAVVGCAAQPQLTITHVHGQPNDGAPLEIRRLSCDIGSQEDDQRAQVVSRTTLPDPMATAVDREGGRRELDAERFAAIAASSESSVLREHFGDSSRYSSLGLASFPWIPASERRVSPDMRFQWVEQLEPFSPGLPEPQSFLAVFDLQGEGCWLLTPRDPSGPVHTGHPQWSPDGSRLAFCLIPMHSLVRADPEAHAVQDLEDPRGWSLMVWDSRTGETTEVCPRGYYTSEGHMNMPRFLAWSPDGDKILFLTALDNFWQDPDEGLIENLHLVDLDKGEVRRLVIENRFTQPVTWCSDNVHAVVAALPEVNWDPDRRNFQPISEENWGLEYQLLNTETGERQTLLDPGAMPGFIVEGDISVSPDLRWAAVPMLPYPVNPRGDDVPVFLLDLQGDSPQQRICTIPADGRRVSNIEITWDSENME
jgi:WD40 repeat protein